MLENIIYHFPNSNPEFYNHLKSILEELPNATVGTNSIDLTASNPHNSKPVISFKLSQVDFPEINFNRIDDLNMNLGFLSVSGNHKVMNKSYNYNEDSDVIELSDNLGVYKQLEISGTKYFHLPINELAKRLRGHVVRIDHTGLNFPSSKISRGEWSNLLIKFSKICNLYKYPTGEDWPFILPATEEEFRSEIKEFSMGREPKFELVYDMHSPVPTIQIDIETDLERSEVEGILPEPYGVSFPDLAEFFRTVYIYHPWRGLSIRMDIRFKNKEIDGAWETGKWLVEKGGRI